MRTLRRAGLAKKSLEPRIIYLDGLTFDIIRQWGFTEDYSGSSKQVPAWN